MPLKKFHLSKFACIFTKANNVCTKVFISKLVVIFGTHNAQKNFNIILIHSLQKLLIFPIFNPTAIVAQSHTTSSTPSSTLQEKKD
jgi:hypothetical protein